MARYTVQDIARAAYIAGFRGDALVTAVAVAFPEGGQRDRETGEYYFTTDIRGDVGIQTEKWGPSVGPWQIRSLKAEHGKGTERDAAALSADLLHAARAAFVISNGGRNFRPWTAWVTKSHQGFVPRARRTIQALGLNKDGAQVNMRTGVVQSDPTASPAAAPPSAAPAAEATLPPMDDQALFQQILTDVADHVAGGKRRLPAQTPTEVTLEELFPTDREAPDAA